MKRKVVQATRSPLNPKRWLLSLACGHEAWVTRSSRPRRGAMHDCERCDDATDLAEDDAAG